jgi:selenocysteine-specific elongation factor
MSCIGTAGHVDHGKSTLVTALTGIDPDRLAEEKARGMTIDLGFAWLTLPSGREVSIVDVPGHESFIKNMLAGVGGIDVALLVVAADEGVMPQTDEHLAILDLLRMRSGVVALTKRDLVDDEWLELVREEVAERLKPTTLAGAPIVACSAATGAGLAELLAALDAELDASAPRRDLERPRLPVDRVFTMTGFGTVVTGTLQDGALRTGQEVEVLPRGLRGRIRGLQAHKHGIEQAAPGSRVAVNLAGVTKSDIARGDVLALPGRLRATTAMDVRLEVIHGAPRSVAQNAELSVYCGAAEVPARLIVLDADELAPGTAGWAQLRLRAPLVVVRGDRFIVRVPSPSLTVGGGVIVEPHARRHGRRDPAALARLELLARGDPEEVALAALRGGAAVGGAKPGTQRPGGYGGREREDVGQVTGLPGDDVEAALGELVAREAAVHVGSFYFAADDWLRLRAEAARLLDEYHRLYPLRPGMPREEWRARLGLAPRLAHNVATALVAAGDLAETRPAPATSAGTNGGGSTAAGSGATLRRPGYEPRLSSDQERAVEALMERFRREPFSPPMRAEVEEALGPELASALVEQGTLVKVSDSVVLERGAYEEAVSRIVSYLTAHGALTVADARDLLGTTRKYMLAIFEHLDERRITRRSGDDRVLGPNAPPAAAAASATGGSAPPGS